MEKKYKVITLCGSTKFKKEFQEIQKKLTLEGNIVISVGLFGHAGDSEVWENQEENTLTDTKKMLDDMHKRKIDMSDEIYVIDVGGYIGESTESEINYAKRHNKAVRYYSQEKSLDVHRFAFQKLTPTEHADLTTYEDAFKYVFNEQNKDVQNVAVTGIYGSGKSSVINTYEKKYKKKFIHISLSHFEGVTNEEDEDILEKKIVNQLLQQVPGKLIPETRFRIKKEFCLLKAILQTIRVVLLGFLSIYFIKYGDLKDVATSGKYQCLERITSAHALIVIIFVFTILLISLLVQLIKWQQQNHIINKVAVKGNEMELADDKDDKSYFNRHIDEILYVLEKITTAKDKDRFDGIIFEDLDRFDDKVDLKIFEKLREICVLGNKRIEKNNGTGQPTLRFFYLLSDDTFLSKERTKFFDYILPIIPVVDTSNAYAKIKEGLTKAGYEDKIDDRFLRGLSLHFDDYRLIKNILNEFQIYAKKLTNIEHNYNELLALIVYKNYFPKDFAALQLHSGYVYGLFDKRSSLIEKETDALDTSLQKAKDRLTALKNESLASEKELQIVQSDRQHNYRKEYADMLFSDWNKTEYPKRLQAIRDKVARKEKEIREEIVSIQTEIIHVNNKKFKDLLEGDEKAFVIVEAGLDDIKEAALDDIKKVQEDKYFDIIKYLVLSGYLDDSSYRDYMACFDENGMSIADKNYLIALNNRTGKPFDYKLDNLELVYENLVDDDFLVSATKNIMLIDYLLRHNKSTSFERFILQLKESKDIEFIAQYLRETSCYESFITEVCRLWDGFLEVVISDSNQSVSLDERQQVVLTALSVCSDEVIKNQNSTGILEKYLEEDLVDASCDDDKAEIIAHKLSLLDIEIQNLDNQLGGESLRREVIENSVYAINVENMRSILKKELACSMDDIDNRFLTSLINGSIDEVANYTFNNLAEMVSIVIENYDKQQDAPEIVQRVSNDNIDKELISAYIRMSETKIEDINLINEKYWNILAEKHTFSETVENVLIYFEKYSLDASLIKYLNESNIKENINLSSEPERSAQMWPEIYKANAFSDEAYLELVEQVGKKIANFNVPGIDENKCSILINHNLITMNTASINIFRSHYKSLMCDFICSDVVSYTAHVRGSMYSVDEVKEILVDERIAEENKIKLLAMTADVISVKEKNLSDIVFKNILENHFDVNDLQYLAKDYEKYNDECKTAIYKVMLTHKARLNSIAGECSKSLLVRLFNSTRLSLTEKANILDVLLEIGKPNDLIAKLLVAAGEDMLARLFSQERSRMSSIDNNAGHVRLLTVLKENKIIKDFSKDEEGKQLKIKR